VEREEHCDHHVARSIATHEQDDGRAELERDEDPLERLQEPARAYFEPDRAAEARIKDETKATVRCIPFDQPGTSGKSIYDGRETKTQVLFAQAY